METTGRRRIGRTLAGFGLGLVALASVLSSHGTAAAQDDFAGWYGPYSDGCSYYWDGDEWTGHIDCGATGSGAGWYGPYSDGCFYWWDGYDWSGEVACDSANGGAGWYGPYDDGCYYWWDGFNWTGDVSCPAVVDALTVAVTAAAAASSDPCPYVQDPYLSVLRSAAGCSFTYSMGAGGTGAAIGNALSAPWTDPYYDHYH